jgi:hypothetical protein
LREYYRTERSVLGDEAMLYIFKDVGKFEVLAHGSQILALKPSIN